MEKNIACEVFSALHKKNGFVKVSIIKI